MRSIYAAVVLLAVPVSAVAAGDKVGELSDVHAWVNRMPGAQATLHVTGLITAPTPCHEASAGKADGSTAADPRIEVAIEDPPAGGMCIQALSDIQFDFAMPADGASPNAVTVTSDGDSKTVDVEEVH